MKVVYTKHIAEKIIEAAEYADRTGKTIEKIILTKKEIKSLCNSFSAYQLTYSRTHGDKPRTLIYAGIPIEEEKINA